MEVYWLERSEADVPSADDWLSENEVARLNCLRFAKRRSDWRLGRWTAKHAVAASLKLPGDRVSLKSIEISAASTGQPEVTIRERPETVSISISHRDGIAICAVTAGNVMLGCDLELVETRSTAFIADYFTKTEQELIAHASGRMQPLLVNLLWSAKESTLKALHVGLRADTRSVEVTKLDSLEPGFEGRSGCSIEGWCPTKDSSALNWHSLQVHCNDGTILGGWWQRSNNILRTVVAAPPPGPPIELVHD